MGHLCVLICDTGRISRPKSDEASQRQASRFSPKVSFFLFSPLSAFSHDDLVSALETQADGLLGCYTSSPILTDRPFHIFIHFLGSQFFFLFSSSKIPNDQARAGSSQRIRPRLPRARELRLRRRSAPLIEMPTERRRRKKRQKSKDRDSFLCENALGKGVCLSSLSLMS